MTETEELKKNAAVSQAMQQIASVKKYLDAIHDEIRETSRRHRSSSKIWLIAWLAWVTVGFFDSSMNYAFLIIFLWVWMYDTYRFIQMRKAYSEYFGAIKVLELLGYIKVDEDNGDAKRRKFYSEFVDIVKNWYSEKKEVQEKAYAPA